MPPSGYYKAPSQKFLPPPQYHQPPAVYNQEQQWGEACTDAVGMGIEDVEEEDTTAVTINSRSNMDSIISSKTIEGDNKITEGDSCILIAPLTQTQQRLLKTWTITGHVATQVSNSDF